MNSQEAEGIFFHREEGYIELPHDLYPLIPDELKRKWEQEQLAIQLYLRNWREV